MDVMLQRHCAKYIYVVPEGLRELMSDISREVLRSQPDQIYTFIADYLDALMITRENARVAARLVESITEIGVTIVDLLVRTGMSREQADKVATIIQVSFRKYLAAKTAKVQQQQMQEMVEEANIITQIIDEAGITPEQAETAAIIIQNAYRNFKRRQEREKDLLKGMVDWRVAARSTMRLYRKTGVTYEEANRAATLIKAAYKGYYTRRIMKRLLEESERVSVEEEKKSMEGEDYSEYTTFWDRFGHEADDDLHRDLEEVQKEKLEEVEIEETSETIAVSIVDSLLRHVIPSSSSSAHSEPTNATEEPGPFPSEIRSGSVTAAEPVEGEIQPEAQPAGDTTEGPPEAAAEDVPPLEGAPAESDKPSEATEAEAHATPAAETTEIPPTAEVSAAETPAESPHTEHTEISGTETERTEITDTTTSEMPATTDEENE